MSAARAWIVAHHGPVVAAALAITTAMLVFGARSLLPVPGQVQPLPLWQLTPPVFAMLASLAAVNRLPAPTERLPAYAARGGWLVAVTLVAALCVRIVDQCAALPPTWPATIWLVVCTFGAAAVVGRNAVWVGAVAVLWIITHVQRYASVETPWTLPDGAAGPVVLVTAVVAGATYVLCRGRSGGSTS